MEEFVGYRQSEESGMYVKKVSLVCWMEMFYEMISTSWDKLKVRSRNQTVRRSGGNTIVVVSMISNIIYDQREFRTTRLITCKSKGKVLNYQYN